MCPSDLFTELILAGLKGCTKSARGAFCIAGANAYFAGIAIALAVVISTALNVAAYSLYELL